MEQAPIYSLYLRDPSPAIRTLTLGFARSVGPAIDRMRRSLEAGEWVTLCEESHKLKGSGRTCGYPIVTELAAELHAAARDRHAGRAAAALSRFKSANDRILKALPASE